MRTPRFIEALVAGTFLILAGCAHHPDDAPRPKNGIAEYGELAAQSLEVMGATMEALARVEGEKERASPALVGTFSDSVDQLRVQSIQVWSRAQAIRSRGDAYFENWRENMALIRDPEVKELAGRHRAELQESFGRVKAGSQQTREDFQPFMVGLRKLRADLENDPGVIATDAAKNLVANLRQQGDRVKGGLTAIRGELDTMTALITPDKTQRKTSP